MDLKSGENPTPHRDEEPLQLYVDVNPFDLLDRDELLIADLTCQKFRDSLSNMYDWLKFDITENYIYCKFCKMSTFGHKNAILFHGLSRVRLDFLHNHALSTMHNRACREIYCSISKPKNNISALKTSNTQSSIRPVHRRYYQKHWEVTFPWLKFHKDEHYMYCKYCRDHPQFADQSSSFFLGSTVFRLDVIRKHNESQSHQRCTNALTSDNASDKPEVVTRPSDQCVPSYLPKPSKHYRKRRYQKAWEEKFSWLHYNEVKNLMYCAFCLQFPEVSKGTHFAIGSCTFKLDALRKHELCQAHLRAVAAYKAAQKNSTENAA